MFRVFNAGGASGSFLTASYRGDVFKMNSITKRAAPFDIDVVDSFVHCDRGISEPATALIIASRHGVIYSVEYLISRGADLDKQAIEGGNTALMEAAGRGHLRVVVALVEAGADVHKRNKDGKTAAEIAEEAGYGLVAKTIEEPGSVTVTDIASYTRTHLPKTKSLNLRPLGCWGRMSEFCLNT